MNKIFFFFQEKWKPVKADEKKENYHKILIVGGGSGGISVAAQLNKRLPKNDKDIAIIEPKTKHYYQPLWTMVGAGIFPKEKSEREEASVIPKGTLWIKDAVSTFEPEKNYVITKGGEKIKYDYMVVATGIELDLNKIKGLKEAIGKDGVCTNYSYDYVGKTWEFLKNFKGGNMIFTYPDTPIKCGGAPQKIMWLSEDYLRRYGMRDNAQIFFVTPATSMFPVKKYAESLEKLAKEKDINIQFKNTLVEIRSNTKEAVFKNADGEEKIIKYDFIHVTPPMGTSMELKRSPIVNSAGYVDVDKYTLQHNKYKNIFSLGDCANLPTSKTIAALTQQAPVVVANLLSQMKGEPLKAKYDGYTACPIITSYNSVLLAEFMYDLVPKETFSFILDHNKPSFFFLFFKTSYISCFLLEFIFKRKMVWT
jgi:NADPH-dependent 2,4-dienoyl-CoA reductase/sulfur reductase-like enzyme